MTFNDIFKSSFLEKTSSFSIIDTLIAFALGLFIFYVYKKTFNGVIYSANFGVSLMAMTLITTLVILAVTSNVILSLGMVGALSIVRFRTAIKEPLDIAFLFWSIAAGIVLGAGLIPLAVIGSIFIGVLMVVFVNRKSKDTPYILVVDCNNDEVERRVVKTVSDGVKKHMVKSKTISMDGIELTLEVRLNEMTTDFVNKISNVEGVSRAVLVSYNGEYMS
ncbi:DUF4956 domain-containing protein [Clostridium bornimense]|uniref:DUF4956 domain-containing protein n=1 Tax=Clostridium bornimense TaxID=1216932 RepID=UPI001C0FCE86|nr:DUF4956 domain-containing protein [Clostridium bornimense]MBU5316333.1 DUF4956 domain-containing protein [Clostridium bornimense]